LPAAPKIIASHLMTCLPSYRQSNFLSTTSSLLPVLDSLYPSPIRVLFVLVEFELTVSDTALGLRAPFILLLIPLAYLLEFLP
jgi:hypothetical protein